MYVGYATDPEIRSAGASGGVITAMFRLLLEEGSVEGVLALPTLPEDPRRPRPIVITDPDDLVVTQQSKYALAAMNVVLSNIADR